MVAHNKGSSFKLQHTTLKDWLYFLLYLTSSSSSSDDSASSEESPQSHESSESESKEDIFHHNECLMLRVGKGSPNCSAPQVKHLSGMFVRSQ